MTIGIYKILHKPTGNFYIGKSKHIEVRWEQHVGQVFFKNHHSNLMNREINNVYDLEFAILEVCEESELTARESHYLQSLQPPYNTLGIKKIQKFTKVSIPYTEIFDLLYADYRLLKSEVGSKANTTALPAMLQMLENIEGLLSASKVSNLKAKDIDKLVAARKWLSYNCYCLSNKN